MELNSQELVQLVARVFQPGSEDRVLAILIDFPDAEVVDKPVWKERRELAFDWFQKLRPHAKELGLERVECYGYRNVRANNADLPARVSALEQLPEDADSLGPGEPFEELFSRVQLLLVPTQFSATAPMKVKAREFGFRAATMPGFTRAMLPALALDYGLINDRVQRLKHLVDQASACDILFKVGDVQHRLKLDLRFRTSHASGGLLTEPGTAGNLPSGETYIVPYEGEGEPSTTAGVLPVQFGADVVLYRIEQNLAVEVLSENEASESERERLKAEPAYGNMAELGLGVLGDMGIEPTGTVLLDEKLGLHIAFGRSDHFGGQVGPADFSQPDRVVHIDRVYLPQIQPDVEVRYVDLQLPEGPFRLMEDGVYQLEW